MADKDFYTPKTRNTMEQRVTGRFKPNGSSPITNTPGTTIFGQGFSVARSATGTYQITVVGRFGDFLHGDATLMTSTITDGGQFRITSAVGSEANTVVTLVHLGEDAGGLVAAEDIASAADNFVTFELVFDGRTGTRR